MTEHAPHCTGLQKKGFHHECPEQGLEYLLYDETVLAVLLRTFYKNKDIKFFTPSTFSQQLGYMNRPTGYDIPPHDHNPVSRKVEWTQETLFIRSGRVRLDLYAPGTRNHLGSCELLPEMSLCWLTADMVSICWNKVKWLKSSKDRTPVTWTKHVLCRKTVR